MRENKKRENPCLLGLYGDSALMVYLYMCILKYIGIDLYSIWHTKYLHSGVFIITYT